MVNLIEWLRYNCSLFRCDLNLLRATLCTRSIQTCEGNIVKALDCNAAVAGRDVLAKTVYARLFDWYAHYQCENVEDFFRFIMHKLGASSNYFLLLYQAC